MNVIFIKYIKYNSILYFLGNNSERERKKQFKIKNILIKKLSKINNKHLK